MGAKPQKRWTTPSVLTIFLLPINSTGLLQVTPCDHRNFQYAPLAPTLHDR